jgi:methanol metabolism-related c-type cytochrome
MKRFVSSIALALGAAGLVGYSAAAQEEKPYTVVDGKVDAATYNGHRRYHSICHTCHGPDGAGGSFAPNLTESLKRLSYEQFAEVIINGRKNGNSVMPAFGENPDVATYLDDIYAYLKARSDGALGRGRPQRMPAGQQPAQG